MNANDQAHERDIQCGKALKHKFKDDCIHIGIDADSLNRKKRVCYKMQLRMFFGSSLCAKCKLYETEDEGFKHKKTSKAPTCKKCQRIMVPEKRPTGLKWHCVGILDGCFNSFIEDVE